LNLLPEGGIAVSVKQVTLVSALAVGAALLGYGLSGCELIASVDRTKILSGAGGAGAVGGAGGAGGVVGGGGAGGEVGGTGGSGGTAPGTCNDNIWNGTETDIDCGGDCPEACTNGMHCLAYGDCVSQFCDTAQEPPHCMACDIEADCAAATDTWCDASVNGGACVAQLADGADCVGAAECLSGNCVDGVCCNTACAGSCNACDVSGSVGTCTILAETEVGEGPACNPYYCAGTADCPTSCLVTADCVFPALCENPGSGLVCVGHTPNGDACGNDAECGSLHCVDSVCCSVDACGAVGDCNICLPHPNVNEGTCGTAPATTPCNNGAYCDGTDACDGGGILAANCVPSNVNPCAAAMANNDANCMEACNESTDLCTAAQNSGSCNDGNANCTLNDACVAGSCLGTDPCAAGLGVDCHSACNSTNGTCDQHESQSDPCTDGFFCTQTDTCDNAGTCVGTGDECSAPAVCDDVLNVCAYRHTITVDGELTDWVDVATPDGERFVTTSGAYTAYLTWDVTNLYVAMQGADVALTDSSRYLLVYVGGASGTTTGNVYGPQTPGLPAALNAQYLLEWQATSVANGVVTSYAYAPSTWGAGAWTGEVARATDVVELRIPFADIGTPTTSLRVSLAMINNTTSAEWTFAGVPTGSFTDAKDADWAKYFDFNPWTAPYPNSYAALP
jgi:hypothetical protein